MKNIFRALPIVPLLIFGFPFYGVFAEEESFRLVVQEGHLPNNYGKGVRFSPNGQILAINSGVVLQLRDINTLSILKTFNSADRVGQTFGFSADSRYLAFLEEDGNREKLLHLYDIKSDKIVNTFRHPNGTVGNKQIQFSSDGKRLFSIGTETLQIWEVETGRLLVDLTKNNRIKDPIVISGISERIASASYKDNHIHLWDFSLDEVQVLRGISGSISSLIFSPNGRRLVATSDDGIIRFWDMESSTLTKKIFLDSKIGHKKSRAKVVSFSPDLESFISSVDMKFYLRDGVEGNLLDTLPDFTWCCSFSPDGKTLVAVNRDRDLQRFFALYTVTTEGLGIPTKTMVINKIPNVDKLEFSSTGDYLIWTDLDRRASLLWLSNLSIQELEKRPFSGFSSPFIFSSSFSPDEHMLVYAWKQSFNFLDLATGEKELQQFEDGPIHLPWVKTTQKGLYGVVEAIVENQPDVQHVYRIGDKKLELVNSFTKKGGSSISPDAKYIVFQSPAHNYKDFDLIDLATGHTIINGVCDNLGVIRPAYPRRLQFGFSPDGRYVYCNGAQKNEGEHSRSIIVFWDLIDRKVAQSGFGWFQGFHPDETYFVKRGVYWSTNFDLVEFSSGRVFKKFAHPTTNAAPMFIKKGNYILSMGCTDGRIWAVPSGELVTKFKGFCNAAFAEKNNIIATRLNSGAIRFLDFPTGQVLLTVYNFKDATLVVSPRGFFSGTGNFKDYVHFVKGFQISESEELYHTFYRAQLTTKNWRNKIHDLY